ncbi:hypothetical protein GLOTRDRAFT_120355 [Gloeophyllum trabeum ATCC 11539]|uniref:Uncharacterized protein n=1 Tax=Gloeophyllum trabeum (strain ATCC 11539 / FP-39264 / Madison 617) TaxID=670483 RepID=S7QC77_GLOTA|nr:uncharacterized protein GLOTRDRAFT_120355 [Gloeophyllum trabeum ATCC 11539]EPQ56957.1 hypothetical protein GLOTRDRAFT_120355 [Gloeophyllum trabeum ATCC 11539]
MSESLRTPWIYAYLAEVGETYGAFLSNVPKYSKNKKVQLIEFLTYNQDTEDSCIWGVVSDKEHTIPVRINAEALRTYRAAVGPEGRRLTEQRNALVKIKDFRPFFSRVPLGGNVKGMTKHARLALEVDFIEVVGSVAEARWGSPSDVGGVDKVRRWTEGLQQDGGGGNILKIEKEQEAPEGRAEGKAQDRRVKISLDNILTRKHKSAEKEESSRTTTKREAFNTHRSTADLSVGQLWRRSWKSYIKAADTEDIIGWAYVPDPVKAALKAPPNEVTIGQISQRLTEEANTTADRASQRQRQGEEPTVDDPAPSPRRRTPPPSSSSPPDASQVEVDGTDAAFRRPTTPTRSEWSPSVHGSPEQNQEDELAANAGLDHTFEFSHLAQADEQRRGSPSIWLPSNPPRSDFRRLSPSAASQTLATHPEHSTSQIPSANSQQARETSTNIPPSIVFPKHGARKVPYPVPPRPRDPNASGPERILVPNSDISGSGSGSMRFTQSQSQSQGAASLSQSNILAGLDRGRIAAPSAQVLPPNGASVVGGDRGYEGDRSSPEMTRDSQHHSEGNDVQAEVVSVRQEMSPDVDGMGYPQATEELELEGPIEDHPDVPARDCKRPTAAPHAHIGREDDGYSSDDRETLATLAREASQKRSFSKHPISPPTSGPSISRVRQRSDGLPPVFAPPRSSDVPILPSSPDVFIDTKPSNADRDSKASRARSSSSFKRAITPASVQESLKHKGGRAEQVLSHTRTSTHDPDAWVVPSFMRKGNEGARGSSAIPARSKRKRDSDGSVVEIQPPHKSLKSSDDRRVQTMPVRAADAPSEGAEGRKKPGSVSSGIVSTAQQNVRTTTGRPLPGISAASRRHPHPHPKSLLVPEAGLSKQRPSVTNGQHRVEGEPKEKLAGFTIDLGMRREKDGPPLITWNTLSEILLLTGRIRNGTSRG